MSNELRFAIYSIKKNVQSSAELRTSFVTNIIGMAINNITFILIWVFFVKSVGIINGWRTIDIVGLQGFVAMSFGIVFSFGAGIRRLPDYVTSGVMDRFLLSPKNLLLRIATASFGASSIGDIIFALITLSIYGALSDATGHQLILMLLLVIISTIVFLAMSVVIFSTSFLFVDANSVTSSFFELFMTPTLFHGGAFQGALRFIFTFVVPSLLIGGLPVEVFRDVLTGKLLLMSILALIWFLVAIKFFYYSVKKYESSNFMTFGS